MLKSYAPQPMRVCPLFAKPVDEDNGKKIRRDLEAGRLAIFLQRTLRKYGWRIGPVYAMGLVAWIVSASLLLSWGVPMGYAQEWASQAIHAVIPQFVESAANSLLELFQLEGLTPLLNQVSGLASFLAVVALPLYGVLFLLFVFVQRQTRRLDLGVYRSITGELPTVKWRPPKGDPSPQTSDDLPKEIPLPIK